MVGAEGVVPGQPVDHHRRALFDQRPGLRQHLLVRAQHAVRVHHALGNSRGAGGEQDLGHGFRLYLGEFPLLRGPRIGFQHLGDRDRLRADRRQRRSELLRVRRVHQARLQQLEDVLQLAEILRHQRIGGRHRCHRDSDVHRAQREEGVVDAVVGKDRHRALGTETAVEQRLRDPAHRAIGFAVRELAPGVVLPSFREKDPIRRLVGPLHQPLGDAARVGAELLRRAQQQAAVGALLELDLWRRELHSAGILAARLRRGEKLTLGPRLRGDDCLELP